jgi:hypothetical protein
LLLMPVISGISDLGGHFLLGLIVGDLSPDIVLVELILDYQVVTKAFIEDLDLVVLGLKLVFFAFVDFEQLLQLKLKEGNIISGLLTAQARVAILICDIEMYSESIAVA